jgi:uncharacterized membrane protein YhaH (DUF805 family)
MLQLFFNRLFVQNRISRFSWLLGCFFSSVIGAIIFFTLLFTLSTLLGLGAFVIGAFLAAIFCGIFFVILTIKRFHDLNKSWWWILLCLVPGVGELLIFIMCGFLKGTDGLNQYGPDPLAPKDNSQLSV